METDWHKIIDLQNSKYLAGLSDAERPSQFRNIVNRHYGDYLKMFTKGSYNKDKAGIGISIPDMGVVMGFNTRSETCQEAELTALYACCEYIVHEKKSFESVLVCTASLNAIKKLSKYCEESRYKILQNKILEARKKVRDLKFLWVPAHLGIYGNALADAGARHAAQIGSGCVGHSSYFEEKYKSDRR